MCHMCFVVAIDEVRSNTFPLRSFIFSLVCANIFRYYLSVRMSTTDFIRVELPCHFHCFVFLKIFSAIFSFDFQIQLNYISHQTEQKL